MKAFRSSLLMFLLGLAVSTNVSIAARVTLSRAPDEGIQPQLAVDAHAVVHLIYFKGDPAGGDIFYVHKGAGEAEFSKAMKVNTQPGTAIAVGTIRGAQLAIGNNGRIHVAWNGRAPETGGY